MSKVKDRFKMNITVNAMVEKDGKVLFMKRSDGFFKGGYWVLPAGHVDGNEPAKQAMIRELKEELGIDVKEENVVFHHVMHSIAKSLERIDLFFRITDFDGELQNKEPEKCDELTFFNYDNLPSPEQSSNTSLIAIQSGFSGIAYSERGFDKIYNKGFSDVEKFNFNTLHNMVEERIDKLNTNGEEFDKKKVGKLLLDLIACCQNNECDIRELLMEELQEI